MHMQWRAAVGRRCDLDTHLAQRLHDAVHGSATESGRSIERGIDSGGSHGACEQSDGCGRVAAVERRGRCAQPVEAGAADSESLVLHLPRHAQGGQRVQHGARDAGDKKAIDDALTLGERGKKCGAVGERLVSRNGDFTAQRSAGLDGKLHVCWFLKAFETPILPILHCPPSGVHTASSPPNRKILAYDRSMGCTHAFSVTSRLPVS